MQIDIGVTNDTKDVHFSFGDDKISWFDLTPQEAIDFARAITLAANAALAARKRRNGELS